MSDGSKKYGWFSPKQVEHVGIIVYGTPDGGEVEVTSISNSPTNSGTAWDDITCVGEVTHSIRRSMVNPQDIKFRNELPFVGKEAVTDAFSEWTRKWGPKLSLNIIENKPPDEK